MKETPYLKDLYVKKKKSKTHLKINTYQDRDGEYIVRLSFRSKLKKIDNSCQVALRRFLSVL